MRKIVNLTKPKDGIVRLMIYNDNEFGSYLFGYKELNDCSSDFDELYESEKEVIESCEMEYGVKKSDWKEIHNPHPNCQHDWIDPVRIKGRESGNPEFGKFEKFTNGKWIEFNPTE